jgi:restriction endonuclease S subunit
MKVLKVVEYKEFILWDVKRFTQRTFNSSYPILELRNYILINNKKIAVNKLENQNISILGVSNKVGIFDSYIKNSKEINQSYYKMNTHDIAYNPYRINVGSIGIKTKANKHNYISPAYIVFSTIKELLPKYLYLVFKTKKYNEYIKNSTTGSVRQNLSKEILQKMWVPIPELKIQEKIVNKYDQKLALANKQEKIVEMIEKEISDYLFKVLDIETSEKSKSTNILNSISFVYLTYWGADKNIINSRYRSKKYNLISLEKDESLYLQVFRGKNPKYSKSSTIILNQKCNRWNDIKLEYAKTVDKNWLENISNEFFTKEGDILINSTGEGTIGRATCITKQYENLLYDSHILLLRVNQKKINPLYLTYFINSEIGQEEIENIKSAQTTKQTELGVGNLKRLNFYIPDLEIQNKIVEKITKMRTEQDQLKIESKENRKKALEDFEKEIFI